MAIIETIDRSLCHTTTIQLNVQEQTLLMVKQTQLILFMEELKQSNDYYLRLNTTIIIKTLWTSTTVELRLHSDSPLG